ncbi:MAG: TetR family transcriptional regulator C-terminal domain-containing protein [Isosphaeraceae bacterium]
MSKESTRETLLDAGWRALSELGYKHAGLDRIVQSAGVPKGSFYYYFTSKEAFGIAVLDRFAEQVAEEFSRYLDDEDVSPLERLRRLSGALLACLESRDCRQGCLVGNLCQEMADQSEAFRERLDAIFRDWTARYATCLRKAREAGEISADLEPETLAEFWLNGWQGAVLRAKAARSTAPIRTFLEVMFGQVLKK